MSSISILEQLREHAASRGDHAAYGERIDNEWVTTDWQEYHRQIRSCARALMHLGVQSQDRVAILANNCPQWAIGCLGTMSARAVSVGIYQTCSADQVRYILEHAETPVVLLEDEGQLEKVEQIRGDLPHLKHVVLMRQNSTDQPGVLGWQQFLDLAEETPEKELDQRLESIERQDIATFIYTSGTTGDPKAVMLSHGNLVDTGRIGVDLHGLGAHDSIISYLPMAHVAEQMMSVHMPAYVAYTVYYAEAPELLLDHLREVQPTIFFAVPRVWERFHTGVGDRLRRASPAIKSVLRWATGVGYRYSDALNRGQGAGLSLTLQWRLADRLLLSRARQKIGLRHLRVAASGAAPITREILDFFAGLGVRIYEVYGLSETCGPGTWNRKGATRLGTVGPPIPGVELKLAEDGEILFRGPNIFQGYFKDSSATEQSLEPSGWFHTGDLGALDDEGFLVITGRKKEIIVTSGGKNISPVGVESHLKEIPVVGDAIVIGDNKRFLTALLTVDEDNLSLVEGRSDDQPAHRDPAVLAAIREGVRRANQRVARVETVRNFRVLANRFSMETGEMTPTLKLKRRVIHERFKDEIESMYEEGQVLKPEA